MEWHGAYASLQRQLRLKPFPSLRPAANRDEHYQGDYAYYDLKSLAAIHRLRGRTTGSDSAALTGSKRKLNGYDYGAFNNYVEGESCLR